MYFNKCPRLQPTVTHDHLVKSNELLLEANTPNKWLSTLVAQGTWRDPFPVCGGRNGQTLPYGMWQVASQRTNQVERPIQASLGAHAVKTPSHCGWAGVPAASVREPGTDLVGPAMWHCPVWYGSPGGKVTKVSFTNKCGSLRELQLPDLSGEGDLAMCLASTVIPLRLCILQVECEVAASFCP